MRTATATLHDRPPKTGSVPVLLVGLSRAWAYVVPAAGAWKGPRIRRVARRRVKAIA